MNSLLRWIIYFELLVSTISVAMENKHYSAADVKMKNDAGIQIMVSEGDFISDTALYTSVIESFFVKCREQNIRFVFLPKFGKLAHEEFFNLVERIIARSDYIQKSPDYIQKSNETSAWEPKIILLDLHHNKAQILLNKWAALADEELRNTLIVHQGDIGDIIRAVHNLSEQASKQYAFFMPSSGELNLAISKTLQSLKQPYPPKINLEDLTKPYPYDSFKKDEDLASEQMIAKHLSGGRLEEKFWPTVLFTETEVKISNLSKMNLFFENIVQNQQTNIITVPMHELPQILDDIKKLF